MFGLGGNFGGAGGDDAGQLGGYGGAMDGADAGAQGGMGGYLASQTQNPNMGDGQQRQGGGGNGGYGVLMSCTCKMVKDAADSLASVDSKTIINGQQVDIINVVGQIMCGADVGSGQVENLHWWITDGTGKTKVKSLASPEEVETAREHYEKLVKGAWVRVCGPLRSFDGQHHIQAYKIRAVEHANEAPNHLMACMYEYMQLTGAVTAASERRAQRLQNTVKVPEGSAGGMFPGQAATPQNGGVVPGNGAAAASSGQIPAQPNFNQAANQMEQQHPPAQGGFGQAAQPLQQQQNAAQVQPEKVQQISNALQQWFQTLPEDKAKNGISLHEAYGNFNGSHSNEELAAAMTWLESDNKAFKTMIRDGHQLFSAYQNN